MPKRQTAITLTVVIALALIVAATAVFNHSQKTSATTTATTTPTTATSTTTSPTTTSTTDSTSTTTTAKYKDGTYNETGSYNSPGGTESIKISVTLVNDVITATSATPNSTEGESKEYQDDFVRGYTSLVVGKNVDNVSLSRVSGSSLTSKGFNAALTKIKADATA